MQQDDPSYSRKELEKRTRLADIIQRMHKIAQELKQEREDATRQAIESCEKVKSADT